MITSTPGTVNNIAFKAKWYNSNSEINSHNVHHFTELLRLPSKNTQYSCTKCIMNESRKQSKDYCSNDFVGECEPSPEYKDDEILLKPVILQTW